jgi:hypothetical protein|tara:strand:+ start:1301 stop:1603 length:303 start_codon:yes stop_codon:yes gene_type:complete
MGIKSNATEQKQSIVRQSINQTYQTDKVNTCNDYTEHWCITYSKQKNMSSKTPYEIRLELIQEARLILQGKATKPEYMPSAEEVIEEAEKLNKFVSKRPE